ncbi:autism susceptibility gene 2 protein homolog isoform X1 [Cimex lectularius]|uniref:Uncharacterized protein n=1 Tax=Cimex lectularius TaxID=79782 RepID=A0A8I6R760_CIMLE|nr:autism susceptibility gene 2 protein homolog isoform X1 [Cimex lectularius]
MDERRQSQRSRRRASRILAEKRRRGAALSCDDESPARERAKPPRRKKKEPLYEEDVVDGFAILSFKTFEDIETCLKLGKGATNGVIPTITRDEPAAVKQERASPVPPKIVNNHHEKAAHDVGTSDDSCREKEKRIIKRDPESEDNRLSDASSRCSSGRGYICDSEGDDDKASDSGSVLFSASPPPTRNHESKPADVQIVNGHTPTIKTNGSPRPETPPPPPPPVQAVQPIQQQPPPQPQPPPPQQPPQQPVTSSNHFPAMPNGVPKVERVSPPPVHVSSPRIIPPPSSTYTTRPGVGYVGYPPPPPQPTICHPTTATSQPLPYQPPLYAPYNNTPYLPPSHQLARRSPVGLKPITTSVGPVMPTTTTSSHRDMVNTPLVGRSHSPRGHSPTRERDSYSSNVSSLSRGSVGTPGSIPPYTAPHHPPQSSLPYNKPSIWVSSNTGPQVSPAASSRLGFPHPFPPPMFPPTQVAPSQPPPAPAPPPNPFSAESLFQSSKSSSIPDQGDLLRRELDSRFLASQDRGPYIRTEMHHHQHQHTHVHQHTTPIIPPPPPTLFTSPIVSGTGFTPGAAVESPFYRQSIGFTGYPGYSPGLMHPTFGPSTPFAPPTHIPTFTPKQLTEPSKPKTVKTGKWNAMHVRVAWEIYHHQQKGGLSMGGESKVGTLIGKSDLLRPPTHMFGPPHPFTPAHRAPPTFEHTPPTFPPMGTSVFGRYPAATATFPSLPAFPPPASMHDPWARLQPRPVPTQGFPPTNPWTLKPDPHEEREREKERERSRERARREEKQRRLVSVSKVRDRSPLRAEPQVVPASSKDDEVAMLSRQQHFLTRQPPRPLPPHFLASPWDPYRYDTLRYNPLVAALREEEEQRAKLFGTYPGAPPSVAHLRPKATSPPHRLPPAHQPKEESSQSR